MDDTDKDLMLDAMFEAAKSHEPGPSADLLGRILADAAEQAPSPADAVPAAQPAPGILDQLGQMFGGWRGAAALTASAMLGLWIGYADPTGLQSDTLGMDVFDTTEQTLTFDPDETSLDVFLLEG